MAPAKGTTPPGDRVPDIVESRDRAANAEDLPGDPSGFICPECGGALWEIHDGKLVKYRCHVGHGFTEDSLLIEKTQDLENALWTALRALEENAALCRRMARRVAGAPVTWIVEQYERRAQDAEARAEVVRDVIMNNQFGSNRSRRAAPPRTTLSQKLAPKKKKRRK